MCSLSSNLSRELLRFLPVTTFPAYASRFEIFWMYLAIRLSFFTVVVAEANQLWSKQIFTEYFWMSRCSSCLAKFFHKLHDPPNFRNWSWVLLSPYVVAAVILPFVTILSRFLLNRVFLNTNTSSWQSCRFQCSTITFFNHRIILELNIMFFPSSSRVVKRVIRIGCIS